MSTFLPTIRRSSRIFNHSLQQAHERFLQNGRLIGDFEDGVDSDITQFEVAAFKALIVQAVNQLHGIACSASQIDILKFNPDTLEAIVRIHSKFLKKFWSSLTLFSRYKKHSCAFRVLQVSSHLMAMAHNSRTMKIEVDDR